MLLFLQPKKKSINMYNKKKLPKKRWGFGKKRKIRMKKQEHIILHRHVDVFRSLRYVSF